MKFWRRLEKRNLKRMLQKLRNRGSSETLNPGQISKVDGTQAHKLRGSSSHSDSPFKKNLGALKRFSLENDGEDDFASPKRAKKPIAKPLKKQPVKKTISKKSSSKKISNPILKRTKDNFKNLDVHPEHLQMALALSKSTFAQEYPESEKEDKEEDLPTFLFPQQIPRVTTFLEKYGFKSNKNKLYPECSKNNLEATKISKHSKFRFLTPALYKRTKEDRESIINSKVSLIIKENNLTVPINTEILEETNSAELDKYLSHNRCWDLNRTMDANEFIVASLNLSPSKQTMGCLLRNWDEIAGRDKSPERFLGNEEKSSSSCDKFKENDQTTKKLDSIVTIENSSLECDNRVVEKERTRQCLSPDLFDDDDLEYTESLNATPKTSSEKFQDEKLPSSSSKSQPVSKITYSLSTSEESVQASPKSPTKMFKSLSQSSVMKTSTTEEFTASFIDPFKLDQEINELISESESIFKKCSPKQSKVISSKTSANSTSSLSSTYEPVSPCISFKSQTKINSSQSSIYSNKTTPTKVETMSVNKQSTRSQNDSISSRLHTEIISPSSSIIDLSQGSSSNDSFKTIAKKTNPSNKSKTRELSSKFESETFGSYSGTSSFTTIEKDSKGIAYFESFYDPTEEGIGMINSFVDLISSDEDDHSNKTRDVSSRNSQEYKGKLVETENAVIEFENVDKFDKSCSNRMSLITKHSTFDSGNISLDYNHTTSLNVTDYVMDILNTQDDTDNRDEAVNQSRSSCSQESIEILSDEELNYSSRFSAQCKNANLYDLDNFDDCIGADFADEDTETVHSRLRNKYSQKKENTVETVEINNETSKIPIMNKNPSAATSAANNKNDKSNPIIEEISLISTPKQSKPKENVPRTPSNLDIPSNEEIPLISTPKQVKPKEDVPHTSSNLDTPSNNIIIKTTNVTPMLDYDAMDTPNVRKELDKFGIKPVKRRRGVDLLKYIYETTHPVVDIEDLENMQKEKNEAGPVKKRKLGDVFESHKVDAIKIVGDELIKNEKEDDLLFERKFSKKLPSCRIPLQIAWYNFLCCNPGLKENILFYEPIHLEVVHSMFKDQSGCNFHLEELITFLDRKCITFRTIQTRKKKKPKKAKS